MDAFLIDELKGMNRLMLSLCADAEKRGEQDVKAHEIASIIADGFDRVREESPLPVLERLNAGQ